MQRIPAVVFCHLLWNQCTGFPLKNKHINMKNITRFPRLPTQNDKNCRNMELNQLCNVEGAMRSTVFHIFGSTESCLGRRLWLKLKTSIRDNFGWTERLIIDLLLVEFELKLLLSTKLQWKFNGINLGTMFASIILSTWNSMLTVGKRVVMISVARSLFYLLNNSYFALRIFWAISVNCSNNCSISVVVQTNSDIEQTSLSNWVSWKQDRYLRIQLEETVLKHPNKIFSPLHFL